MLVATIHWVYFFCWFLRYLNGFILRSFFSSTFYIIGTTNYTLFAIKHVLVTILILYSVQRVPWPDHQPCCYPVLQRHGSQAQSQSSLHPDHQSRASYRQQVQKTFDQADARPQDQVPSAPQGSQAQRRHCEGQQTQERLQLNIWCYQCPAFILYTIYHLEVIIVRGLLFNILHTSIKPSREDCYLFLQ